MSKKAIPARRMIQIAYGDSKNFMTPNIIKYGKINRDMAYELSSGEDFYHKPMYGVSIAAVDPTTGEINRTAFIDEYKDKDLSKSFTGDNAYNDAKRHIGNLKIVYK